MDHPYLSVVVTTRNDNHGGNPLGRTQAFLNGLAGQCRRYQIPTELIIVEWNPPPDRPPLADVLEWPDDREFFKIRIIEVPPEIHRRMRNWEAMPLYQMIGKNVGIRRAHGEYVLATNIDILFSDELMRFIAGRRLERGKMYRVNRWDAMADVPVHAPIEEQLAYCESHLIRLNSREGTFRLAPDGSRELEEQDIASRNGPLKLGHGWFQREMLGLEPFRWVENDAELLISSAGSRTLRLDVEPGPGVNRRPFLLELRDASGNTLSEIQVKRRSVVTFPLPEAGGETERFSLGTHDGGTRIRTDLRTLNFRVFSCTTEKNSEDNARTKAVPTPARRTASAANWGLLGRGLRMVQSLWRGPGAHLSRGAGWGSQTLANDDVLPPGLSADWSYGWYSVEHFGGETFRWMQQRSAIVWLPPTDPPADLILHVEPGPAVGFKACEVVIRDQWGDILGTHKIRGRSAIRIPVKHVSGPFVTSFEVRGGGSPRDVGDPRSLALRLLACNWEGTDGYQADSSSFELSAAGAGAWTARGWCSVKDRQIVRGLPATSDAELVLRTPSGPDRKLTLSVVPGVSGHVFDLCVEDFTGRVLYQGDVDGPSRIQLSSIFSGDHLYALRLQSKTRKGTPAAGQPMLFLTGIQWDESGGVGDSAKVTLNAPTPVQAVPLHTNACGDFTLTARDHWMDLRAYPEFDLYSMNIDSIFCWMAHHGGAREEVLPEPMRIYHIEHGVGSGWTPEGEKRLFNRIADKGLSWVDYPELVEWGQIMNRYDAPMIFNRADWGFANDQLKETDPVSDRVSPRFDATRDND